MYAKTLFTMAGALILAAIAQAATPDSFSSINGHGTWVLDTGDVYENHQP